MSEYTSTLAGFQRAMEWSLNGPESGKEYAEATVTPEFYHIMNGQRTELQDYIKGIDEWQKKVSDYKPVVDQFLRQGDELAAHMTGTIKINGDAAKFESFMFAKIDKDSGKIQWLNERSVWGPADGPVDKGLQLHDTDYQK